MTPKLRLFIRYLALCRESIVYLPAMKIGVGLIAEGWRIGDALGTRAAACNLIMNQVNAELNGQDRVAKEMAWLIQCSQLQPAIR